MTNAEAICSTASYRRRFYAPEEVDGRVHSKERDVWSFGCLCYEVFLPSLIGGTPEKPTFQRFFRARSHTISTQRGLKCDLHCL
jgi:serine/threonine protein kinase